MIRLRKTVTTEEKCVRLTLPVRVEARLIDIGGVQSWRTETVTPLYEGMGSGVFHPGEDRCDLSRDEFARLGWKSVPFRLSHERAVIDVSERIHTSREYHGTVGLSLGGLEAVLECRTEWNGAVMYGYRLVPRTNYTAYKPGFTAGYLWSTTTTTQ